jgi:cytochrome oxidase Cu insertion factor (SCO1/SenC/PrrC family)
MSMAIGKVNDLTGAKEVSRVHVPICTFELSADRPMQGSFALAVMLNRNQTIATSQLRGRCLLLVFTYIACRIAC